MRLLANLAVVTLLGFVASVAAAQSDLPAPGDSRFTLHPTDDGYLRLDGRTGQIAACSRRAAGWSCHGVSDDRATPEAARASELLAPRPRPRRDPALQRMMMAIETVWQRVVVMVAEARNGLKGGT
jgi:hypothetical protein